MTNDYVRLSKENRHIKQLPEGIDMSAPFDDGLVVVLYNYSDGTIKTDYLSNMSREHQDSGTYSQLFYLYYRNVSLQLGVGAIPMHPSLREIAFHDVTFGDQLYLEKCPKMEALYFVNCTGTLRLDGLELAKIVIGSEKDRYCFKLNQSTAERVLLLSDVTECDDPKLYLESHFIRHYNSRMKRQEDEEKAEKGERARTSSDEFGFKIFVKALMIAEEKKEEVGRLRAELELNKAEHQETSQQLSAREVQLVKLAAETQAKLKENDHLAAYKKYELAAKAMAADEMTVKVQQLNKQQLNAWYTQQQYNAVSKDYMIKQLTADKQQNIATYHAQNYKIGYMKDFISQQNVKIQAIGTNYATQLQYTLLYSDSVTMKMKLDHVSAINTIQASILYSKDAQTKLQAEITKMLMEKYIGWGYTPQRMDFNVCLKCGSSFYSELDLRNHQRICGVKHVPCYHCGYVFTNEYDHSAHYALHYYGIQYAYVTCQTCLTIFPGQYQLQAHSALCRGRQMAAPSGLTCYSCGITMYDQSAYRAHMMMHPGGK